MSGSLAVGRRPRGFGLVELLAVLTLLGAVALLALHLTTSTTRLAGELGRHWDRQRQVDHVLRTLRADLWDAERVSVEGGSELDVQRPGRERVRWRIEAGEDEDRHLFRQVGEEGEPEHVLTLPAGLGFASHPLGAELEVAGERTVLRSQRLVLDALEGASR